MKKRLILIILSVFALANISAWAALRISFTVENRRVIDNNYLLDIYAEPSSSSWLVGATNIVLNYNREAIDASNYYAEAVIDFDTELENAGYYCSQGDFSQGNISLDILTIVPSVTKTEKFKIATIKLNIIDDTKLDNISFCPALSLIYQGNTALENSISGNENNYCCIDTDPAIISAGDANFIMASPYLESPANNSVNMNPEINLDWRALTGSKRYVLEIADEPSFSTPLYQKELTISDQTIVLGTLSPRTKYYWHVLAYDMASNETTSATWAFTTGDYIQNIALKSGWNLISSHILPNNTSIAEIFATTPDMYLIKNGSGNIYLPSLNINNINTWDYKQGYLVYMLSDATLDINGTITIPENETIHLQTGWNMVAYLRNTPISIATATDDLLANNSLYLVKSSDGSIFLPSLNINTIGELQPGQGYLFYMLQSADLTYPANN